MANYLLRISFDGTLYSGTQRQNRGQRTVQGEIESALKRLTGQEISIRCSSRLDAGVSARDFCISFRADLPFDDDRLSYLLNSQLDKSIRVVSSERVDDDFDARGTPHRKEYRYLIDIGVFDPILDSHAWVIERKMDLKMLKKALFIFLGEHSFASFSSLDNKGDRDQDFRSEITRIDVHFLRRRKLILIRISGRSFHRYQVRMMVGAAVQVALGKLSIEELERRLEQPDIDSPKHRAPAEGLTLWRTEYRGRQ